MIQVFFCQLNNSSWLNARSGRGSNLCNSINNFVTSFSHNLFINSLLQREKRMFLGGNYAFKTEIARLGVLPGLWQLIFLWASRFLDCW